MGKVGIGQRSERGRRKANAQRRKRAGKSEQKTRDVCKSHFEEVSIGADVPPEENAAEVADDDKYDSEVTASALSDTLAESDVPLGNEAGEDSNEWPERNSNSAEAMREVATADNTWKGLATAFCNIMSQIPKSRDDSPWVFEPPVLRPSTKIFESERVQRKENRLKKKRALRQKAMLAAKHVTNQGVMHNPHELQLKKLATKGVVKLFNALMEFRRSKSLKEEAIEAEETARKKRRKEAMAAARGQKT